MPASDLDPKAIAMSKTRSRLLLALCSLLAHPFAALAGFNEAVTAYQAKDYPTALQEARQAVDTGDARGSYLLGVMHQGGQGVPANASEAARWYDKAARGGVVGAFAKLAQLHARGEGVPKDSARAIALARLGDQFGDPEGSLFLYVALTAGPLGYLDAGGKPDHAKYRKLAARPLSERVLDTEARDALYRAVAKNHPLAGMALALSLGATLGDGNRERMLALAAKLPNHNNQALRNYEKIARHMERLGQTYTTPQLFLDSQVSQTLAGMIQTCGLRDSSQGEKPVPPELIAVAISKPLADAVYLPSKVGGYEHAYLVAGEWEESWTYRGCGNTGNVIVKFTADGLGGAFMASQQKAKAVADSAGESAQPQ